MWKNDLVIHVSPGTWHFWVEKSKPKLNAFPHDYLYSPNFKITEENKVFKMYMHILTFTSHPQAISHIRAFNGYFQCCITCIVLITFTVIFLSFFFFEVDCWHSLIC